MVSQVRLQNAARHFMWDVSTSHLTQKDSDILTEGGYTGCPRTVPHEYGGIVFVDSDAASVQSACQALRERGMSETFLTLYQSACRDRKALLINFDRDADVLPGIPTFEW